MANENDKQTLKERLEQELSVWETKMDEAKVQMHLGAKEVKEKLQPHVKELEQGLDKANKQLEELKNSSGGAWGEIQGGLESSLQSMKQAFEKAEKHFKKDDQK